MIESPPRGTARATATGGAVLWLGMLAFGSSTVGLLAVLARHPHRATFSSLAALLSLAFVVSLIPSGVQLRSASLVADGRPLPRMTFGQATVIGAVSLALSPLLAFLLHVPAAAAALVSLQMVVFIPLAAKQGALLAQHRFKALGINLVIEGGARFLIGAGAGLTLGVTGLAAGLCAGTAVALIALPYPRELSSLTHRPRTSVVDTSLSLALLGLYVQLDVLIAPSVLARGSATGYDLAAVPSKGVYLMLLAAGPLIFPFVRRREGGRRLIVGAALVTLAVGVVLAGLLTAALPLIATILGRPKAGIVEFSLLGLGMALAGVTGIIVNASVARGVKRPWPPLVLGIATLLLCWPFRPSGLPFAIALVVSQAVTAIGSVVICFWGRRREVVAALTASPPVESLPNTEPFLAPTASPARRPDEHSIPAHLPPERLLPAQPRQEASRPEETDSIRGCAILAVTFTLPVSVGAERVAVCGEWNDWSPDHDVMSKGTDSFSLTIALEVGRTYRFRYLLDGIRWENDWNADAYVPNVYGSDDSVVDLSGLGHDRTAQRAAQNGNDPNAIAPEWGLE